jgi:hypothetical protein
VIEIFDDVLALNDFNEFDLTIQQNFLKIGRKLKIICNLKLDLCGLIQKYCRP